MPLLSHPPAPTHPAASFTPLQAAPSGSMHTLVKVHGPAGGRPSSTGRGRMASQAQPYSRYSSAAAGVSVLRDSHGGYGLVSKPFRGQIGQVRRECW